MVSHRLQTRERRQLAPLGFAFDGHGMMLFFTQLVFGFFFVTFPIFPIEFNPWPLLGYNHLWVCPEPQRMRAAGLATSNSVGWICSSADGRQRGKGGARLCNGVLSPGTAEGGAGSRRAPSTLPAGG